MEFYKLYLGILGVINITSLFLIDRLKKHENFQSGGGLSFSGIELYIQDTYTILTDLIGSSSLIETDKYGIFNAGFMYFSDIKVLDKWKQYTLTSRFYEQASLEDLNNDKNINTFHFNISYNYGWWTFFQSNLLNKNNLEQNTQIDYNIILNNFKIDKYNGNILYDYINLKTIHVHMGIHYDDYQNNKFKQLILDLLNKSNKQEYKLLLNYINNINNLSPKYKIYIPNQPRQNSFYNHNNEYLIHKLQLSLV